MAANTSLSILDQIAYDAKQRDDVITAARCALLHHLFAELIASAENVIGWVPGPVHFFNDEPQKAVERVRAALDHIKAGQA